MAKGRKHGCPLSVKNWIFEIQTAENDWTRIHGINSMTRTIDSDTEDGSADTDDWAEPFVSKRNGSLTLEGTPVVEASTGYRDDGQTLLEDYSKLTGCDADVTIRITDPYGHSVMGDYIVTSYEESVDNTDSSLSVDLEMVGAPETVPYVTVTGIEAQQNGSAVTTLALTVGDPAALIKVAFTPADSSNKRFKVSNTKRSVCAVVNVTEDGFSIEPQSAGAANIVITSINAEKTTTIAVTVSDQ